MDHPSQYTASLGFKFNADDWKVFTTLVDAGPNFELRVAGGVYRFDSNATGFWELMVHSATGKIYGEFSRLLAIIMTLTFSPS